MKFNKRKKQSEITETMVKMKKEQQKCSHKVMRGMLYPMLLALIVGDMLTIYPLIDAMFYQSQLLSFAITLIAGLALEGIPYVAAHFIMKEKKDRGDIITISALGVTFLIIFILLFNLRFHSQDLQYQAEGAELSVSTDISEKKEEVFTPTDGQSSMTLLLSVLPFCTSVLALALSCAYRPKELRKESDELNRIRMEELLAVMDASSNEVKKEMERDLTAYDDALYQTRLDDLDKLAKIEKFEVRRMLAMKLGTPDSASELLEGGKDI